jgi:MOSC domain-containing protein YiiM
VMPREGIFAIVIREGTINPGDEIRIISSPLAGGR